MCVWTHAFTSVGSRYLCDSDTHCVESWAEPEGLGAWTEPCLKELAVELWGGGGRGGGEGEEPWRGQGDGGRVIFLHLLPVHCLCFSQAWKSLPEAMRSSPPSWSCCGREPYPEGRGTGRRKRGGSPPRKAPAGAGPGGEAQPGGAGGRGGGARRQRCRPWNSAALRAASSARRASLCGGGQARGWPGPRPRPPRPRPPCPRIPPRRLTPWPPRLPAPQVLPLRAAARGLQPGRAPSPAAGNRLCTL